MTHSAQAIAIIRRLCDAGATVAEMQAATGLKQSRIYSLLREHRPDRPRQARRCTSDVPFKVRGLVGQGIAPRRAAELLGVTPAYVYAILSADNQQ